MSRLISSRKTELEQFFPSEFVREIRILLKVSDILNVETTPIEIINSQKKKEEKMLNRKQNDLHEFTNSSKFRHKINFTERECQPSVIDRARLTLFNFTDIWKSKIDANKVNKSCESMTANRKAFDVLTAWTKHRRSPSAEPPPPAHSIKPHKRGALIENGDIHIIAGKNKSKCNDIGERSGKSKHKRNNKSNHSSRDSMIYTRRRSFDGELNEMYCDKDRTQLPTMRHRRMSWGNLMHESIDNQCYASKIYANNSKREKRDDSQLSVAKARLKFKKIKTCDDLYANQIAREKPIKVFKRQTSVVPIITINDCDYEHSTKVATRKTRDDDEKMNEVRSETAIPRKKLSFREPVVFNEKLKELRAKHSTKNHSNADERIGEKICNDSMDISRVPLEV